MRRCPSRKKTKTKRPFRLKIVHWSCSNNFIATGGTFVLYQYLKDLFNSPCQNFDLFYAKNLKKSIEIGVFLLVKQECYIYNSCWFNVDVLILAKQYKIKAKSILSTYPLFQNKKLDDHLIFEKIRFY